MTNKSFPAVVGIKKATLDGSGGGGGGGELS